LPLTTLGQETRRMSWRVIARYAVRSIYAVAWCLSICLSVRMSACLSAIVSFVHSAYPSPTCCVLFLCLYNVYEHRYIMAWLCKARGLYISVMIWHKFIDTFCTAAAVHVADIIALYLMTWGAINPFFVVHNVTSTNK